MTDQTPFGAPSDGAMSLPPIARSAQANGMPLADPLEADARRGSVPADILSAHSAASLGGSYLTAEISASAIKPACTSWWTPAWGAAAYR